MRYDFNILEEYAQDFLSAGYPEKATKIYLFMADGDQSLDGGHLGKKLGECYERLGDFTPQSTGTDVLSKRIRRPDSTASKPASDWRM